MSYVRWSSHSDVYVFMNTFGDYVCCSCSLNGAADWVTACPGPMRSHLLKHRKEGDKVPDFPIERLERDYDRREQEEEEEQQYREAADLRRGRD